MNKNSPKKQTRDKKMARTTNDCRSRDWSANSREHLKIATAIVNIISKFNNFEKVNKLTDDAKKIPLGVFYSFSMKIRFQFDLDKAIQAMFYIVKRLGVVDKFKLIKLLYISDKEHFIAYGYPITGDSQSALPYGPVPSLSLDALNGQAWPNSEAIYEYLELQGNLVHTRRHPEPEVLTNTEKEILNRVLDVHGHKSTWDLVDETHKFPEYVEVYVDKTSTPIPYEVILKHHGGERRFRKNRPVIDVDTASKMLCPFDHSEPDL